MNCMEMGLKYYPEEDLRIVAAPIDEVTDEVRDWIPKMFEIMYATRGVGLAGPQVGIGRRLIVANPMGDPEEKEAEEVYINPEIVEREGAVRGEEGCLSLPGIVGKILRAQKVVVRYTDFEGKEQTVTAEDWKARIFQHEIDHLEGILIIDKMSPAELTFYAQDIKELEESHKEHRAPRPRAHSEAAL